MICLISSIVSLDPLSIFFTCVQEADLGRLSPLASTCVQPKGVSEDHQKEGGALFKLSMLSVSCEELTEKTGN